MPPTAPCGVNWVKSGGYSADGTTGDTASVWTFDANGRETSIGPAYGPFPGWTEDAIEVAADGTTREQWVRRGTYTASGSSGDQASIWTLDATGKATSQGPAYGPFPGWAVRFFQIAPDKTVRLEWAKSGTTTGSGDTVSLWTLNAAGSETAIGPAYGPYPGWVTYLFEIAPDGTSRLQWVNQGTTDSSGNYTGDEASVWALDATGKETSIGPTYGRFPNWRLEFAYPITSSVTDLFWLHEAPGSSADGFSEDSDEFSVWNLDATGKSTHVGPVYGPF